MLNCRTSIDPRLLQLFHRFAPWAHPKRNSMPLTDKHGRSITDLRVSITDRCNYRCVYCRSGEDGIPFSELPMPDYIRIVRVFVSLGIEKVRITGGEPLLRKELLAMVGELAAMTTISGKPLDVAITTNGHLLA